MPAKLIDGKKIADALKQQIALQVADRLKKNLPAPGLDVLLVGENPASESYIRHKQEACRQVGIYSHCHRLPASSSETQILERIHACNEDPSIHGILLQLPLPSHLEAQPLLEAIDPKKDVDGFNPYNMGRLVQRMPILRPCTPYGIIKLLENTGEPLAGKHAVILGASNIVGRPMALELLIAKCTVTICHRFSQRLDFHIKSADILISAMGKTGVINSEWIQLGTIVIDVGFNRLANGKIVGDIDFDSAKERAAWITPVPGGVGQMTVATLLENTLLAASLMDANH